jgi:single-strand DNA-binding protein
MANDVTICITGNLTDDPILRFTPSGAGVCNFTVASTPRTFDKNANDWKDGDAMFLNCSVWRQAAENVAETLTKGMRVIVQGRLKSRTYETKEGEKRTVFEVEVDEVGPCLRYATAKVTKTTPGWSNPGPRSHVSGSAGNWASPAKTQGADPWAKSAANDEPPF